MRKQEEREVELRGPRDSMWYFEYSDRMNDIQNEIYDIAESIPDSPSRAERKLRKIIEKFPHAFDAFESLAYILEQTGRRDEAMALLKRGLSRARELFPREFKLGTSPLPWGILENRPFLRMYARLGYNYLELGEIKLAKGIFEDIVWMNPDDNQGVREALCSCYFSLEDPHSVLNLCNRYSDDGMPAIAFGRVLALLKVGRPNDARRALRKAAQLGGNIVAEIMSKKHTKVNPKEPWFVTVGSRYEAYLYWKEFGKHWQETPGAIELVRVEAHKSPMGNV